MAVNTPGLGLQEDVLLIGTHDITVNAGQLDTGSDVIRIKDHVRLLTGTETLTHNLLAAVNHLTVTFTVKKRIHTINLYGIISTLTKVCKLDFTGRPQPADRTNNSYEKK